MSDDNKEIATDAEILWVRAVRNNILAVPFWVKTFATLAGGVATFQFLIKPWMSL